MSHAIVIDDDDITRGIFWAEVFSCQSGWAYSAYVRIADGRAVVIDCETQWSGTLGLNHSKNGRRWGLYPLRSRVEAEQEMVRHAEDVVLSSSQQLGRVVVLERARLTWGLSYRCLCDCGNECELNDPYAVSERNECRECAELRTRAKARAAALRAGRPRTDRKPLKPAVRSKHTYDVLLPRELLAILEEDDIPERLAAHTKRMQQMYPALKFTKKHAARALLVKALRIAESEQKGRP